ncbi:MAG: hypothetical protein JNK42_02055 [Caedimonas sp.]|nr:hypothetical protein [Caedimonas sp.]
MQKIESSSIQDGTSSVKASANPALKRNRTASRIILKYTAGYIIVTIGAEKICPEL